MGPIKNGGIGTHCHYLGRFLREQLGHEVTILFSRRLKQPLTTWKKEYRHRWGITLLGIQDITPEDSRLDRRSDPMLQRSRVIYEWLKSQSFHFCHFQDWEPDGFVAIQAKRSGQAFAQTTLTFTTHSSAEWSRHGMQSNADRWTRNLAHDFMERYCAEHADLLLSPTQYMLDWMESRQWRLAAHRQVAPLLFDLPFEPKPAAFAGRHLIFFGRLETRKGVLLFLKALEEIVPHWKDSRSRLRITFLGRAHQVNNQPAADYIQAAMKRLAQTYDWQIISDLGQPEALRFLADHADALVVIPSLVDNLPFTVIECLQLQLNLIASRVGGIPELIHTPERLFEPTVSALSAKLLECLREGVPPGQSRYRPELAQEAWRKVHEENASPSPGPVTTTIQKPRVSVCVAYFNHGEFLPHALESLEKQTYRNFEVIVVDDGSTDSASKEVFRSLQRRYASTDWKFIEKENGYLGQTRNFAARQASGDFLVFVDADNVAAPEMLERMVRAINTSGAACLTCHHLVFVTDAARHKGNWLYRVNPLGPCLELAVYENVLGDANFIVRRSVFEKVGGFSEDRDLGYEDWEFLLKLIVDGHVVDVIPEPLFYYRRRPSSMVRSIDRYLSHQRALRPVLERLDPWQRRFLQNAVDSYWTLRADLSRLERARKKRKSSMRLRLEKIWRRLENQP
jgi:O-antigen biosynthesis protein